MLSLMEEEQLYRALEMHHASLSEMNELLNRFSNDFEPLCYDLPMCMTEDERNRINEVYDEVRHLLVSILNLLDGSCRLLEKYRE